MWLVQQFCPEACENRNAWDIMGYYRFELHLFHLLPSSIATDCCNSAYQDMPRYKVLIPLRVVPNPLNTVPVKESKPSCPTIERWFPPVPWPIGSAPTPFPKAWANPLQVESVGRKSWNYWNMLEQYPSNNTNCTELKQIKNGFWFRSFRSTCAFLSCMHLEWCPSQSQKPLTNVMVYANHLHLPPQLSQEWHHVFPALMPSPGTRASAASPAHKMYLGWDPQSSHPRPWQGGKHLDLLNCLIFGRLLIFGFSGCSVRISPVHSRNPSSSCDDLVYIGPEFLSR